MQRRNEISNTANELSYNRLLDRKLRIKYDNSPQKHYSKNVGVAEKIPLDNQIQQINSNS